MKKQLLFGMALVLSAVFAGELLAQAAVSIDPAVYTRRGVNNEMQLTNKWLYSNKLNNYNVAADLIAPAGTVRGMAVKDGKMLFINRNNKRIDVVNGATGARETSITLASNLFTYLGRNKADTADSTYTAGLWGYQDIKVDNAGNVLLGNIITSNTGRFQIWKVDLTTGAGTLVIDQADLATLYPTATTMRFDAFGVWGDVTNNAVILAASASTTAMEVYSWKITNGVAAAPELIELDASVATGKDFAGLANLGTAPQVFPLDDTYFYVDGNATFPVLCDKDGNTVDGFKATLPTSIKDSVTAPAATPKTIWTMGVGHNGLAEFEVNGKYFLVMAASNTAGVPASTFRLFQFADASKAFSGLTTLWTFPQAGMGAASNGYRTAMPCVEVSGTKANIYVYTGENGYGMYELETAAPAGFSTPNTSKVAINVVNNTIQLSETVATITVFNTTGQKFASAKNVAALGTKLGKGIYLVSITDLNGDSKVQKVAVN
jgi:hypothetical protein